MTIGKEIIDKIVAHARQDSPIEACGLLIGMEGRVTHHRRMANTEKRADHFTFDPHEQLAAFRAASEEGLEVIGVYHSHPETPARPSAEDIRLAHDPSMIHVIVSLMHDQVTVKAFRIARGKVTEEIMETIEEERQDGRPCNGEAEYREER